MTEGSRFEIVFVKLQELVQEEGVPEQPANVVIPASSDVSVEELDEIDELRRMVMEITDPEFKSYTTT
jgi:hypothetical protein